MREVILENLFTITTHGFISKQQKSLLQSRIPIKAYKKMIN